MGKNEFCNNTCERLDACAAPAEGLDISVASENVCLRALDRKLAHPNVSKIVESSYMMEKAIRSQDKKFIRKAVSNLNSIRREEGVRALRPGLYLATMPVIRARVERRPPNDDEIEETKHGVSDYLDETIKHYLTLLRTNERDHRGATQGAIGEAMVIYSSFFKRSVTGEGNLIHPSFVRQRPKHDQPGYNCHTVEPGGFHQLEVTTRTLQGSGPGKLALRQLCEEPFEKAGYSASHIGHFVHITDMLPLADADKKQVEFGLNLASGIQGIVDITPITSSTY